MNKSIVSLVKCRTYEIGQAQKAVKKSIDLLGGIEKFIKPGAKVLLKPNLLSARAPEEGVNTHPEIVRAVARCVKAVTPHILVGDSPGGWSLRNIGTVYEKSGINKVCEEEGLKPVKFDKAVEMNGFPIAAVTKEVDFIISIPKLKTHSTTILTGAIKNTFGMVVGLHKAQCHLKAPAPDEFAGLLVKVFGLVKPALSIMDGVVGMEGEGPAAGSLRSTGLIIASPDAVALDAVLSSLIGLDPFKIPTIREAAMHNKGIADLNRIEVLGEKPQDVKIKNFKLSKTFIAHRLPRGLVHFGLKKIRFYPYINKRQCRRCGLCFNICPSKAVKKNNDGALEVAVKECIHCFCCYEVCPYKAITLKKSFLARFLIGG